MQSKSLVKVSSPKNKNNLIQKVVKVKIQSIVLNKESSQGKTGHTQSIMELEKGNKDNQAKMERRGRV